jgi:hypothetical protein
MTDRPHPHLAELMKEYARDLGQVSPSPSLDARIDQLVAAGSTHSQAGPRQWRRPFAWAAAAGFAVVAISAGIVIGVRLERARDALTAARATAPPLNSGFADLAMWPSDSVALTIPAEYSPQGTLVAVNPQEKSTGQRYLIDVVVSNDGTMRIERIVPANGTGEHQKVDPDGVTLHAQ